MITSIMHKYAVELTGSDAAKATGIGALGAIAAPIVPFLRDANKIDKRYTKADEKPNAKVDKIYKDWSAKSDALEAERKKIWDTHNAKISDLQRKYGLNPTPNYEDLLKLHPEVKDEIAASDANARSADSAIDRRKQKLDLERDRAVRPIDRVKDNLRAARKRDSEKAFSSFLNKAPRRALIGAALPAAAYLTYRKLKNEE